VEAKRALERGSGASTDVCICISSSWIREVVSRRRSRRQRRTRRATTTATTKRRADRMPTSEGAADDASPVQRERGGHFSARSAPATAIQPLPRGRASVARSSLARSVSTGESGSSSPGVQRTQIRPPGQRKGMSEFAQTKEPSESIVACLPWGQQMGTSTRSAADAFARTAASPRGSGNGAIGQAWGQTVPTGHSMPHGTPSGEK
jgi:hypothetical protein